MSDVKFNDGNGRERGGFGFWEEKMGNRMVSMYLFVPFIEEISSLLVGAKNLWHPWSVERRDQLSRVAGNFEERARMTRQHGLAWASNVLRSRFGGGATYVLSTAAHYRYRSVNEDPQPNPDATPYLVSLATSMLFAILPMLQKAEKEWWEENGKWVKWASGLLEVLMEAPYCNPSLRVPRETMRLVGMHAVLLECEGLATTQAIIEDAYNRKWGESTAPKVPSGLSDAEMQELASKIGIPLAWMKDALETEYSSWWDQADVYRKRAQAQKEAIVESLSLPSSLATAIQSAWDPGSAHSNSPEFLNFREDNIFDAEMVIKTLIPMFLFFDGNVHPATIGDERGEPETESNAHPKLLEARQ